MCCSAVLNLEGDKWVKEEKNRKKTNAKSILNSGLASVLVKVASWPIAAWYVHSLPSETC